MASVGNVTGTDYSDLVTAVAAGNCGDSEFTAFVNAFLEKEQVTSGMVAFFKGLLADIDAA